MTKLNNTSNNIFNTIIFDMDGVMINSEKYWFIDELNYLRSHIPSWDEKYQRKMIGKNLTEIFQYLKNVHGFKVDFESFLNKYDELAVNIYKNIALENRLLEIFDNIKSKNLKLALCTSSPDRWVKIILDRFNLRDYFDVIITSSNYSGKGKPSPDVFNEILKRLHSDVANSIVIEDSANGVCAAKKANLKVIGYLNGFNLQQDVKDAAYVIDNLIDIKKFI